jgi:hypothetical protein
VDLVLFFLSYFQGSKSGAGVLKKPIAIPCIVIESAPFFWFPETKHSPEFGYESGLSVSLEHPVQLLQRKDRRLLQLRPRATLQL